jgi:ABC-type multidrug transport system fused ATPase/permease subunit
VLAVFGCGGYLVASGAMPIGTLLSVTSFIWILVFGVQGTIYSLNDLSRMTNSLGRIYDVVDKATAAAKVASYDAPKATVTDWYQLSPLMPKIRTASIAGNFAMKATRNAAKFIKCNMG